MKKIVAIIKPFKFEEVHQALREHGAQGVTVTEVQGIGRQMGHTELFHGNPYVADFLPKVMIEVIPQGDKLDEAILAIRNSAQTGRKDICCPRRTGGSHPNRRYRNRRSVTEKAKRAAG